MAERFIASRDPMRITDIASRDVVPALTRVRKKYRKDVPIVRTRIVAVYQWAVLNGHRSDNPASTELPGSALGPAPSPGAE